MRRILPLAPILAFGALLQNAGCWGTGDLDQSNPCTTYSNPPAPQLVPVTLSELAKGVQAVVGVQSGTNVTLTLNLLSESTRFSTAYNPSQCPQLSASAALNGLPMAAASQAPQDQSDSCGNAYRCSSPSFFNTGAVDVSSMSTMDFALTDSSGSYEIKIVLPNGSINGANVLTPDRVVSVSLADQSASPTSVVIGAPEVGAVFIDVTSIAQPTAGGFTFVMPSTDLSVSSSNLVDQDWDAGASSCGAGGAVLPCNAALEITFPPLFEKCDFSGCDVDFSSLSYGAPSGIVLLPVTLGSGSADAGLVDASDGG